MTDTTDELELFDDAQEEFPGKEDLKDRLVLVWATGKHGQRKGANGKPYDWYETITLVLDDGPNWTGRKIVDGDSKPILVPAVADEGPQRLDPFQWSTGGMTSRLANRVQGDKPKSFKPFLGRINSRPNSQKGFNASWSIAEPTADDKATAVRYAGLIKQIGAELEQRINGSGSDDGAFD